jgi:phytoene/squalene synthetase
MDYCRRVVRCNYENFSVVSFLLPRELRVPMEVVYAYCRYSDDLGDNNDGSQIAREMALEKLNQWEHELNLCFEYARQTSDSTAKLSSDNLPMHPIFVALIDVVRQFNLPKEPFTNLLVAFKQDQTKQHYETMDDLLGYCCNSADPVGRIVLHLAFAVAARRIRQSKYAQQNFPTIDLGNKIEIDRQLSEWSDSICTGLQLANFWQDIARDFAIGRCYIPNDIASKYGVNLERLEWNQEFQSMMCELVADARERILYGVPLLDKVPSLIKFDIALIIRGGLAILDAVKNINYNVLKQRPTVSRLKKFNIAFTTLLGKKIVQ